MRVVDVVGNMNKLLQSHFLALYCMVLADGIIDSLELQTLYEIGVKDYGLTPEEILEAVRDSGTSFSIPESFDGKIRLLHDMAKIAWADGSIDDTERRMLKKYIIKAGFQPENADAISEYILESVHNGMDAEEITRQITQN